MPIEGIPPPGEGATAVLEAAAVRSVAAGRINLQIGEILQATVIGTTANQVVLDVKGSPLSIDRAPGLDTGTAVRVRVTGLTPQPTLEIERILPAAVQPAAPAAAGQEAETTVVNLIRGHLGELNPDGASLAQLHEALGSLTATGPQANLPSVSRLQAFLQTLLPSPAAPDGQQIAHFVEDGGLHYEAKLAALVQRAVVLPSAQEAQALVQRDLKGLLLQVHQDLTSRTGATPVPLNQARLSETVANSLTHLETLQGLNLLAQLHGTPYQLALPLLIGQALSQVQLGIEPDSRPGQEDPQAERDGFNLFLQLDLDGYGATKIDVRVLPRSIRVNFFVAQPQGMDELRTALPLLQQALRSVGFDEVLLAADSLDEMPPDKAHKFAPLLGGVPSSVHLLDETV